MGVLASVGQWLQRMERRQSPENPSTSLANPAQFLVDFMGGNPTASGERVSEANSLRSSAVFAATRVLSETVASLPLFVYERLEPRGKERRPEHPLFSLLHDAPNPRMTSMQFRETLMGHLALWGNGYAEIVRDGASRPVALWPLLPDRTEPINGGQLYKTRIGTEQVMLPADRVLHIAGLGFDGIKGYSVIGKARQAVGLSLATEEFGARWFGQGSRPSGVLKHPGKLTGEAAQRLRQSWAEQQAGLSNAQRAAVLEEGMEWQQIGVPPEDSQFLETRKFQVSEIARIFRIPPHMMGDLERATFSNVEQAAIDFVVHTIRPWLVRWEQEIQRSLFTDAERGRFFAEFKVDALLRGDTKSRFDAYAVGRNWGWLSIDDVRELENMNPLPDGQGDAYLRPLNMAVIGEPQPEPETPPAAGERAVMRPSERRSITSRQQTMQSFRSLFEQRFAEIVRRETQDVTEQARKLLARRSKAEFFKFLDGYYGGDHPEFIREKVTPLYLAYAERIQSDAAEEVGGAVGMTPELEEFVAAYVASTVRRWVGSSEGQIREVVREAEEPVEALDERFGEWSETRPDKTARREANQAGNAVSLATYVAAGVLSKRWNAVGSENCPYCRSLDGRVIGVNATYIGAGEAFDPEGTGRPLTTFSNIGHPPSHRGCLVGDSRVLSRHGIVAASKRWFDGDVVIFETSAGHKLTCTPNHPILTPQGWIAARLLNKGSRVVCDGGGEWRAFGDRYNKNVPTCIEDIAKPLLDAGKVMSSPVPVSAMDFHGDGVGSKVAVVGANRQLWRAVNTPDGEQRGEVSFQRGDRKLAFLAGSSSKALLSKSLGASGSCPVCGGSLSLSLAGSHLRGADQPRFAGATNGHAGLHEVAPDDVSGDAQVLRDDVLGLPGTIFADDVVNVEVQPFHGYVYNLQTEKGWYSAENIITHNCDCVVSSGF